MKLIVAIFTQLINEETNYFLLLLQVGDKVKKGQVICIIEAMKLMNEIEVCIFPFLFGIVYYYIFYSSLLTMLFTLCFPI